MSSLDKLAHSEGVDLRALGLKPSDMGEDRQPLTGKTLGDRIKESYVQAGLRRRDVERRAGLSYQAIYNWEKGAQPKAENLQLLAKATGYTMAEIIGETLSGQMSDAFPPVPEQSDGVPYEAWGEFLIEDEKYGYQIKPAERAWLSGLRFPEGLEPTPASYTALLSGYRMGVPPKRRG